MKALKEYGGWALITGASSGIGEAYARHAAAQGIDCILVARREDRLRKVAEELERQHGVQTRVVICDLSAPDCLETLTAAVGELPIGILINNAGFGDAGAFATRAGDKIARMIQVNCLAVAEITRHYLPHMLERRKGAIIIVGSTLSLVSCPFEATYAATKAFDLALSEALHYEVRDQGVDVLAVCPSLTATEFFIAEGMDPERAQRMYAGAATPDDIAQLTFGALGHTALVGPRDFKMLAFARRVLPRALLMKVVIKLMHRMLFDAGAMPRG